MYFNDSTLSVLPIFSFICENLSNNKTFIIYKAWIKEFKEQKVKNTFDLLKKKKHFIVPLFVEKYDCVENNWNA